MKRAGLIWLMAAALLLMPLLTFGQTGRLDARTRDALLAALDDERRVQALYQAVLERFGEVRPFVNIIQAEKRHESLVAALMKKYGVPVPPNPYLDREFTLPNLLTECCAQGIEAEKANIAMYNGFLTFVKEKDIRQTFTYLRDASLYHHLPAFERCAAGLPCPGFGGPGRQGRGPRR